MPFFILTFLTFMGQIIATIFEGEWPIILVLNFIVFLGMLALLIGLLIGLWQGHDCIGDSSAFARQLREQAQQRGDIDHDLAR